MQSYPGNPGRPANTEKPKRLYVCKKFQNKKIKKMSRKSTSFFYFFIIFYLYWLGLGSLQFS